MHDPSRHWAIFSEFLWHFLTRCNLQALSHWSKSHEIFFSLKQTCARTRGTSLSAINLLFSNLHSLMWVKDSTSILWATGVNAHVHEKGTKCRKPFGANTETMNRLFWKRWTGILGMEYRFWWWHLRTAPYRYRQNLQHNRGCGGINTNNTKPRRGSKVITEKLNYFRRFSVRISLFQAHFFRVEFRFEVRWFEHNARGFKFILLCKARKPCTFVLDMSHVLGRSLTSKFRIWLTTIISLSFLNTLRRLPTLHHTEKCARRAPLFWRS